MFFQARLARLIEADAADAMFLLAAALHGEIDAADLEETDSFPDAAGSAGPVLAGSASASCEAAGTAGQRILQFERLARLVVDLGQPLVVGQT